MSSTLSPNMNLPIPGVGTEAGPTYAEDVNSALTLVDSHDHTTGNGVAITPSGLNINAALTLQNNFITNAAGLTFTAQTATPAVGTIYEAGADLYFVDGNSNNVRLTQNGNVAGSVGSIANLVSPASAAYVSATSTFVWQSNTGVAANMDAGALLLRNLSPNSTYALTLSPPSGMASNTTITLPTLPASQKFMTLDNLGAITAPVWVDDVTTTISSGQLIVRADGINTTQLHDGSVTTIKLAASAVATAKIADSAVTAAKLAYLPRSIREQWASTGTFTWIAPAGVTDIWIEVIGAGGGGGGGYNATNGGGGGGGGGALARIQPTVVVAGSSYTVSVGGGGSGGNSGTPGGSGATGGASSFNGIAAQGGRGGTAGALNVGGSGGIPAGGGAGAAGGAGTSGSRGGGSIVDPDGAPGGNNFGTLGGGGGGGCGYFGAGGAGGSAIIGSAGGAGAGAGAGGGGGAANSNGGSGADGYVAIFYTRAE